MILTEGLGFLRGILIVVFLIATLRFFVLGLRVAISKVTTFTVVGLSIILLRIRLRTDDGRSKFFREFTDNRELDSLYEVVHLFCCGDSKLDHFPLGFFRETVPEEFVELFYLIGGIFFSTESKANEVVVESEEVESDHRVVNLTDGVEFVEIV